MSTTRSDRGCATTGCLIVLCFIPIVGHIILTLMILPSTLWAFAPTAVLGEPIGGADRNIRPPRFVPLRATPLTSAQLRVTPSLFTAHAARQHERGDGQRHAQRQSARQERQPQCQ